MHKYRSISFREKVKSRDLCLTGRMVSVQILLMHFLSIRIIRNLIHHQSIHVIRNKQIIGGMFSGTKNAVFTGKINYHL